MASPASKTLQVGCLSIKGNVSPDGTVASFLGIPFAQIPARWRQAGLVDAFDPRNAGVLDATKYGPMVPQPASASTAAHPEIRQSEFECLNINVWAPAAALEGGEALPVIAWVHGGGYMWGHNATQDGSHLVRRSIELGKPILVVAINYRMHLLGLVGCKELRDEALALGEHGYYNLGLHDQRLGFQWIQRHIHFFGGSPTRVTAMGESAGAHSILWHMHSSYPAFQRAIVHSSPFHQPLTRADHQAQWDALFAKLGVAPDAPGAVKLAAARSLSADEVVAAYDNSRPAFPCVDDGFLLDYDPTTIGEGSYWGTWPSWVEAVVIGTMKEEGSFCLPEFVSAPSPILRKGIIAAAGSDPSAQAFLAEVADAYGVVDSQADQATAFYGMQKFVGDGFFVCHAVDTAREAARQGRRVYFECFDQRDDDQPWLPWLGPGKWAYHAFDVPFLFYAPPTQARPGYKQVADDMSRAYTTFAHSDEPWEGVGKSQQCGVYTGEGLKLEKLDDRVKEGDALMTTPERRGHFRRGAYELHLNIFKARAKRE